MRYAVLLATLTAGCGLAANGLDPRDAGTRPSSASGEAIDASQPAKGGAGSLDAGTPPHPAGDAAAAIDSAPPVDANDAAPTELGPYDMDVPATDGPSCPASWFDTGIDLPQGASVSMTATGTWNYGPGPVFQCGPSGTSMGGTTSGFPFGALMGQIAGGAPFPVGASYQASTPDAGRLLLGMNDDFCGDNQGSMHVTVTVVP
jgi:hypothetical protein